MPTERNDHRQHRGEEHHAPQAGERDHSKARDSSSRRGPRAPRRGRRGIGNAGDRPQQNATAGGAPAGARAHDRDEVATACAGVITTSPRRASDSPTQTAPQQENTRGTPLSGCGTWMNPGSPAGRRMARQDAHDQVACEGGTRSAAISRAARLPSSLQQPQREQGHASTAGRATAR
jgi:hypothetical protein